MDDCRRIIFCVYAFNRISYNRFSKIPICITLSYTFIDSIFQTSTNKMNILPYFYKDDCHSGILTNWYHILICYSKVLL